MVIKHNSSSASRPVRGLAAAVASSFLMTTLLPMANANVIPGAGLAPTQLVTGKMISPVGTQQNVGSLPMNMILTPDGKYALVSDMGFREYLTCLNTATGQLAQPITSTPPTPTDGSVALPPVSKSLLAFGKPYSGSVGLYYGLAVKSNGEAAPNTTYTVYAAQGANASIAVVKVAADGSLTLTGIIKMKAGDFPAGLSLDSNGRLYVAVNTNNSGGIVSAVSPASLVIYNTATAVGTSTAAPELARVLFNSPQDTFGTYRTASNNSSRPGPALPFTPSSFPFAVDALANGSKVYVSSQRDGGLYVVDTSNLSSPTKSFITTGTQVGTVGGSHPVSLLDDRNVTAPAGLLYVANAGDDSVSVINTVNDTVVKTISVRPQTTSAANLPGVTPTGLALSADGATLYTTLADMNAVAIVNTAGSTVTGAIPVGWYPTSVVLGSSGNILVANAKGTTAAYPNPQHTEPLQGAANQYEDTYYDQSIIEGNVSNISIPDAPTLANDTTQVIANNVVTPNPTDTLSQIGLGGSGQIKHVIYIVKENRTYDQVLGDVSGGNGDPSLTVFGQSVTPNLHAIVNQFALFDNFYDCAEVSGDGWNWSTEAMASEYVIRNLPYQYSSRGRSYDFEGQVNGYPVGGFPAKSPEGVQYSKLFPNGAPVIPDVDTPPGGYIWDNAENHGLTFRNYGFFLTGFESSIGAGTVPDNYPTEPGLTPGGHYTSGALDPAVNGHSDLDFRLFDTDYADSDAPTANNATSPYPLKTYGKFGAKNRFQEWNREFQAMLAADSTGSTVPNLMTIKFMSDHTAGYSTGKPTPVAHVADNDFAVAELVDAVSHSPIWNSTAIFVIEDDAQAGPDHVDCHRSTCYVISPYVTPHTVDHNFHNTSSVVKSIELLLGLPMMNQYDAYAPSFGADFSATPSAATYTAIPESQTNALQTASAAFLKSHPAYKYLVALTKKMNFSKEDLAPAQLLNEVIWKSVKGMNSKMPAPRHGVIPVHMKAKTVAGKTGVKAVKAPAHDDDDD